MGRGKEPKRMKSKHAMDSGKPKIFRKIFLTFIILIILVVGGALGWYNLSLRAPGTVDEKVEFEIALGSRTR